ncbi:ATP-dependent DNA ligase [Streptomyces collinus]|uniref:ATP-dependent DNA ligase n=1 Tax=Streptomyces collinus TaxID=42684 RepID=UPI003F542671
MTWTLPEPMLAAPVSDPDLPAGWAAEPKWSGWRALLSWDAPRLLLRSRRGTGLEPSFPELRAGAAQLPDATALDGELVVWDAASRLAFERLQGAFSAAAAARLAWPGSGPRTSWPSNCSRDAGFYRRRDGTTPPAYRRPVGAEAGEPPRWVSPQLSLSQADDDEAGVVGDAFGGEKVVHHGVGELGESGVDVLVPAFDEAVGVAQEGVAVGEGGDGF